MKALALLLFTASFSLLPAQKAPVRIAVHLVVPCSKTSSTQTVNVTDAKGKFCLDRAPFLTQSDVQSAEVHKNRQGQPVVFLTFHDDAARRELEVTRKNIGSHVAIVLNGRIVSAPAISAGSRQLFLDAAFSPEQAETVASALNRQAIKH